jgi:hypothetical protein
MCEFCGDEKERRLAENGAICLAEQLERVAGHYRALAAGRIKPHTDAMKSIKSTATSVIRKLVEDFV